MKAFCLIVLFISTPSVFAKEYKLHSGSASYTVTHTFKTVEGVSKDAKGKMVCGEKNCEFLIAIRIDSFRSSDSNRDLNMLTILESDKFPLITIRGNFDSSLLKVKDSKISSTILLHGIEKDYVLQLTEILSGTGHLTLDLGSHQVQRPSLLTVKIKNEVPIHFNYTWQD